MKKIFLTLAVFVMAICASAQTNQYFWYQGNLMMGNPIAQIDSVTFGEEDTDSILIYLPRTIIKTIEVHDTTYITVHDSIYVPVHDTSYILIHDTICPNIVPEGALPGLFSIAADKQVRFSKGNLQYQASTGTWRFAENQWDYVGDATRGTVTENDVKCNNSLISSSYNGWIDLFGWGTGNNPTLSSNNNSDYATFSEWGANPISNGGNSSNQWRSVTYNEWQYLFHSRTNANNLRGLATVNNVKGMVILQDNCSLLSGQTFIPTLNDWTSNVYTESEWTKMESVGAIFLPCAGRRVGNGTDIDNPGIGAHYSSASAGDQNKNGVLYFGNTIIIGHDYRFYGLSVRLVQDVVE